MYLTDFPEKLTMCLYVIDVGTMSAFGPAVQISSSASAPQRTAATERSQQLATQELSTGSLPAADGCLHPDGRSPASHLISLILTVTDHFRGPGREVDQVCVCLAVCPPQFYTVENIPWKSFRGISTDNFSW